MINYNDIIKNLEIALEIAMRPTLRKNKILNLLSKYNNDRYR
jgi:hypothetical protein